jgi:hypothetical protein
MLSTACRQLLAAFAAALSGSSVALTFDIAVAAGGENRVDGG